jgi:hypothetical protein
MSDRIFRLFRHGILKTFDLKLPGRNSPGNRNLGILLLKKCFQICRRGIAKTNNPGLINQERDRNDLDPQLVERIGQHRPGHLLPLHVKTGPVGMLLLNNPRHLQPSSLHQFLALRVPPGHMLPTPRSPRGEQMQQQFFALVRIHRNRLSPVDGRQREIGKWLSWHEIIGRGPLKK